MEPITLKGFNELPVFESRDDAVEVCGEDNSRRIRPVCDSGDGRWYVDFAGEYTDFIGWVVLPPTVDVV